MARTINLDEIETGNELVVTVHGKEHTMKTYTLGDYVEHLKNVKEAAEKDGDEDGVETFNAMVSSILGAFPTMKEQDVRRMTMFQLNTLMDFMRSHGDEEIEEEDPEGNE